MLAGGLWLTGLEQWKRRAPSSTYDYQLIEAHLKHMRCCGPPDSVRTNKQTSKQTTTPLAPAQSRLHGALNVS